MQQTRQKTQNAPMPPLAFSAAAAFINCLGHATKQNWGTKEFLYHPKNIFWLDAVKSHLKHQSHTNIPLYIFTMFSSLSLSKPNHCEQSMWQINMIPLKETTDVTNWRDNCQGRKKTKEINKEKSSCKLSLNSANNLTITKLVKLHVKKKKEI